MDTRQDFLEDQLAGGLLGLLIGDALGVPYEFKAANDIPPLAQIDFDPPKGFRRSHEGVLPGTWSDDGAQALCLLESLLDRDGLDLRDFADRLVNWREIGYMAVDGIVFDVGNQTTVALRALESGVAPKVSGPSKESDNGNGSLMRVLPLALWHKGDDLSLARMAALQCLPTHGHVRAQVACAMYCLWARAELTGHPSSWDWAAAELRSLGPELGLPHDEIELVLDPKNLQSVAGSGYVLDTLWSAKHVVDGSSNYADTVRKAIALGNDTDTTACVAGGIAGIRYGLSGIPETWRVRLRGQEILGDLQTALLVRSDSAYI